MGCYRKAWVIATAFCPRGTRYMLMLCKADYSKMGAQHFVLHCILHGCVSTVCICVRLCKYRSQITISWLNRELVHVLVMTPQNPLSYHFQLAAIISRLSYFIRQSNLTKNFTLFSQLDSCLTTLSSVQVILWQDVIPQKLVDMCHYFGSLFYLGTDGPCQGYQVFAGCEVLTVVFLMTQFVTRCIILDVWKGLISPVLF
jgi:hypothetical protein